MIKTLDWNATEARARTMTSQQLWGARLDCTKTAEIWDAAAREDKDPEGNGGFYRDEASVYAAEMTRRNKA